MWISLFLLFLIVLVVLSMCKNESSSTLMIPSINYCASILSSQINDNERNYIANIKKCLDNIYHKYYDNIDININSRRQYNLFISNKEVYTENHRDIYLVIWNSKTKKYYDSFTIMYAAIHELTHVISTSHNHEYPFDNVEKMLFQIAKELNYYNSTGSLDPDYPCRD